MHGHGVLCQRIRDVFNKIAAELGLSDGATTSDGKFSLCSTRCIGCCGLAPVMTVGDDVYGKLTPAEVPGILAKYRGLKENYADIVRARSGL